MEKASDFFDTWLKSQERFIENWSATARKLQESLLTLAGTKGGLTPDASTRGVFDLYHSWTSAVINALKENGDPYITIVKDTLAKTFSSSDAYMKLYDMWLPLAKTVRDKAFQPESFRELIDPARYKEVIDTVLGLSSPETISAFFDQAVKLLQTAGTSAQGFAGPWTEALQKSIKILPGAAQGHPESFMNIFHAMFNAFDSTFGRVFHVPAVGKDREKVELLLKGLDGLSVYLAKNTEYQHMAYVTGLAAMEKVLESVAHKGKKGEGPKDFNEFFTLWIEVNEKAFFALFKTEDFAKLQGELLDASLSVRKHFFKFMELYLYDFPIALRSEMDDLYKTIYDLKKKVRGLENKIKRLSPEEAGS